MAIKAISLTPQDFVCKDDVGDNPTIWKIRGLTRLEWMEIENSVQTSAITLEGDNVKQISNQTNAGTVSKLMLDYGLVGWENFKDESDQEVPFNERNKDRIPRDARDEISTAISKLTSLAEKDAKN